MFIYHRDDGSTVMVDRRLRRIPEQDSKPVYDGIHHIAQEHITVTPMQLLPNLYTMYSAKLNPSVIR